MKYKTLFRMALKVVGVYMVATGLCQFIAMSANVIFAFSQFQSIPYTFPLYYFIHNSGILYILIGLYLFFKGEWIVNKAIPSNRPYCHECGYELTQATTNTCPECGTAFKSSE